MIEYLRLHNVGPAPGMEMELAPGLNLITGDNGLGKSFLLDVIWWALTRKWPQEVNPHMNAGYAARPRLAGEDATIEFRARGRSTTATYESRYAPRDQAWVGPAGRPLLPGLVIYAHTDGSFSFWDPARNYWRRRGDADISERRPAQVFTQDEVWNGAYVQENGRRVPICNGLIIDWAAWISAQNESHTTMKAVIEALASDGTDVRVEPESLSRISIDDPRDIPTLRTGYGEAIPILHASVVPQPEPRDFDQKVREPGSWAVAELVGRPSPRTRGRPVDRVASSPSAIPGRAFPDYWRRVRDDLRDKYNRACAFSGMRIHRAIPPPQDAGHRRVPVPVCGQGDPPPRSIVRRGLVRCRFYGAAGATSAGAGWRWRGDMGAAQGVGDGVDELGDAVGDAAGDDVAVDHGGPAEVVAGAEFCRTRCCGLRAGRRCTNQLQHEVKFQGVGPRAYEFACRITVESFSAGYSLLRATESVRETLLCKPGSFPRFA